MKFGPAICLIILCLYSRIHAQVNLVPNPSFEDTTACPFAPDEMSSSVGWSSYGNSPDYFNSCAAQGAVSVPNNWGGYQQAASGSAYAAFATRSDYGLNYREFIGRQLISSLTIGTTYYVSLCINLSISNPIQVNCATNNIGVKFSTVGFSSTAAPALSNYSHINSVSITNDTADWIRIFGSFVADSAYSHIVIGNFFTDANTDSLIVDAGNSCTGAYYYLDDVCVSTDSSFAANYTSLNDFLTSPNLKFYPNPTSGLLNIYNSNSKTSYSIYNLIGETVMKGTLEHGDNAIDVNDLTSGCYFFQTERSTFNFSIVH